MSHALCPHKGLDIFVGNLVNYKKVNETSTEARLATDSCTPDYTNSWTAEHRVYCVAHLGPRPFCQTNTMQILVACYRDCVANFVLLLVHGMVLYRVALFGTACGGSLAIIWHCNNKWWLRVNYMALQHKK